MAYSGRVGINKKFCSLLQGLEGEISRFSSKTSFDEFEPRPDDVFISTPLKSGTTLLQQILYQLKVVIGDVPSDPNGKDFEDISCVVPFVEACKMTGVYEPVQSYSPRFWKTHSCPDLNGWGTKINNPNVGSFICITRDLFQAAPSFLDFAMDWIVKSTLEDETMKEEFLNYFLKVTQFGMEVMPDGSLKRNSGKYGRWFSFAKSWLDHEGSNVMFLLYEDIVKDMRGTIAKVADFVSISVTAEQIDTVMARCDRTYMSNDMRFNDRLISRAMDWPESGGRRVLPEGHKGYKQLKIQDECVKLYKEKLKKVFGVNDFDGFANLVREREERRMRGALVNV